MTRLTLISLILASCGIKVKTGGETHHYIHVDGQVTANINANIAVIGELCKQTPAPDTCLIDAIVELNRILATIGQ